MQWSLNLLQINKLHTTCMIKLIKDFNQIVFILEAYSKLRKISLNKKKEYIYFFALTQLWCYHLKTYKRSTHIYILVSICGHVI